MPGQNECRPLPACPVETTLTLIGDKWKVLILRDLLTGTKRFGELKRSLGGVSQKVLTANLRQMERDGLVHREVYPEVPPRVEYSLTETGQERREQGHGIMEVFAQRVVERMGEGRFRELIKQWERFGDVLETEIAAFRNVDGMEE